MKTRLTKTLSFALAPIVALSHVATVYAQTVAPSVGSAEAANASEVRLSTVLNIAQYATRDTTSDENRNESIERIKATLLSISPEEKIRLIDHMIAALPTFQEDATRRSDRAVEVSAVSGIVLIILVWESLDLKPQGYRISVIEGGLMLSMALVSVAAGMQSFNITKLSKKNIRAVRAALNELKESAVFKMKAEKLNSPELEKK